MRIVAVEHVRCGENDRTDYYVCPDNLIGEEIQEAIAKAKSSYLEAVARHQAAVQPTPVSDTVHSYTNDNLTVGEIKKQVAEYKKQYDAYQRLSWSADSFATHLCKLGFTPLCDYEGVNMTWVEADWGHRHGQKLKY